MILYLAVPALAWATLEETLAMDCESSAFDKELRDDIREALDKVQDVTQYVLDLDRTVKQTITPW